MKTNYFDIEKAAKESKVPGSILQQLKNEAKVEFHHDPMMYELHVLRAIKSRFWEKKSFSIRKKELVAA
jgi:hypothetical protein